MIVIYMWYSYEYLMFSENILNLLNTTYISDANNNDRFATPSFSDFDAKSAAVFYGQGLRWNMGLSADF